MKNDVTAIVPAAGRGTRFGAARNKVLEPLLGRPILRWTLEALAGAEGFDVIVVAASPGDMDFVGALGGGLPASCTVVSGGKTRQQSVRNALEAVSTPFVAVHDAARPLVSPDLLARCVDAVRVHGTAVAAFPVADTLKDAPGGVVRRTVSREGLWAAQTPQCARTDWLREAYEAADREGFAGTDEASLLEHAGREVHLVTGSPANMKITTPDDLALADAVLHARSRQAPVLPRIGYGYDIHRFAPGRRMILGGVDFGLDEGLLGHSDADALLHAVMDALLGAAGLPDIGHLFPNTDERWRGASSMDLLAEVVCRVGDVGYAIGNVDATVVAERPKIAPRAEEMRANIARVLGIPVTAVGLKATTNEGIGGLGAGEGLAAHAVAMIFRLETRET